MSAAGIDPTADITAVWEKAVEAVKPLRPVKLPSGEFNFSPALEAACDVVRRYLIGRSLGTSLTDVDRVLLLVSSHLSLLPLAGYASLNESHIREIYTVVGKINEYILDPSRRRPLNVLILGPPGAGKSHLAKCIASRLAAGNVEVVSFNMANLQSGDDFARAIDKARSVKIDDKLPLLFLDEFDSSPTNYSLLLPVLWDGVLSVGSRDLRLGKIVVVLAGSSREIPACMNAARSMNPAIGKETAIGSASKLLDVLSRINGGVIKIPSLSTTEQDRGGPPQDHRPNKIMIAIHLLRNRFGDSLQFVVGGLLHFVAHADFRYDVRSMAHLIDMIPFSAGLSTLDFERLSRLPLADDSELRSSSLAYHVMHEDGVLGLVRLWNNAMSEAQGGRDLIPIYHEAFPRFFLDELWPSSFVMPVLTWLRSSSAATQR